MNTTLTCARCRQPTRPFPEGVMEGKLNMQPEAPFKARLAYKCIKCDRILCACCCHPAAVVKEMLQPGRFSLPEEFEGAHPQAACPECRGMVLPFGADEVTDGWAAPTKGAKEIAEEHLAATLAILALPGLGIGWGVFEMVKRIGWWVIIPPVIISLIMAALPGLFLGKGLVLLAAVIAKRNRPTATEHIDLWATGVTETYLIRVAGVAGAVAYFAALFMH